jgi:hypothetical protein
MHIHLAAVRRRNQANGLVPSISGGVALLNNMLDDLEWDGLETGRWRVGL